MIDYPYNLHSHTCFGDGKNTPGEMAKAAFSLGFKTFGFSEHSVMPWYEDWCMSPYGQVHFIEEVTRLKREYEGKMEIVLGLEMDLNSEYSEEQLKPYEYVIGSAHSVRGDDGVLYYADNSPEEIIEGVRVCTVKEYAERYFENVITVAKRESTDILGHFDLILKYNEGVKFLDESGKWYRDLALCAAEEVAKTGVIVEVNTGAISRGARSVPYPTKEIIEYMASKGVRFILSSDTHSVDTLDCHFGESIQLLKSCNVNSLVAYENGKFTEVKI